MTAHRVLNDIALAAQVSSAAPGQALAFGVTVPADAQTGYGKGCFFVDRDASAGSQVYINEGSNTSSAFKAISSISGTATLTNKTLTSPVVNNPSGTVLSEVVTATNVITAAESGSVFYLNSATEFVSTLPAPALGLRFTFIVSAAPSGASYTVICASSGTLIKGHVLTNDLNSGTDSDFGTSGELTLTFVDGKSVAGDRAVFDCDGTNWFVQASCSVFDAITIS